MGMMRGRQRGSSVLKTYKVHPATVRALLKKAGYNVDHWYDNGRIKGLADFHGHLEVKEHDLSWVRQDKTVCVHVSSFNDHRHGKVDWAKLRGQLREAGYTVVFDKGTTRESLVVVRKNPKGGR